VLSRGGTRLLITFIVVGAQACVSLVVNEIMIIQQLQHM